MPEIRQNVAIREWVIIATERAKRPEDFIKKDKEVKILPEYVPTCPFCPGNEAKTPQETYVLSGIDNQWSIRVTPNLFPALALQGERIHNENEIFRSVSGVGIHEVIIEHPKHNLTTALYPVEHIVDILKVYKNRYLTALDDKRVQMIILFKNHGESAGTSLEHPHSQMIATPVVPNAIRNRISNAMDYFDNHSECVFCKTLRAELDAGERIIIESKHFVGFIPYAAMSPFHTWILPKRHMPSFPDIYEAEMADLALVLKTILLKIYKGLDNPDFNYVVRSLPGACRQNDFFHWYISIVPRLTKAAGFELGSGMFINTSLPEASAKFLREVTI
jgi:UDPglucose--hexose-1-phosphate uridylyltransferase